MSVQSFIFKPLKAWNKQRANHLLLKGVIEGKLELVKKGLEYGANLECRYNPVSDPAWDGDDKNATPLLLALQNNHLTIAEFLLEKGSNPHALPANMWNGSPLYQMIVMGKIDLVKKVYLLTRIDEIPRSQTAPCSQLTYEKYKISELFYLHNKLIGNQWDDFLTVFLENERLHQNLEQSTHVKKMARL